MFPSLTGNGRIWIYVSNRALNSSESAKIKDQLDVFCKSWSAHGSRLKADFDIFYNQLLVLGVDEDVESASGCSIDKATAIFQRIDNEMNLDLFNRMNLSFLRDGQVRIVQMRDLSNEFHENRIQLKTTFLDNSITKLEDLRARWEIPFQDSWAFKKVKVTV